MVGLPDKILPFPTPLSKGQAEPKFRLRGTKGWAWTPEQFLAEIPTLAQYKMNFLMSCYTCVFTDMEKFINRWWEPIPEVRKKGLEQVVRACQEKEINFCFSMHPQLYSERPLKHDSPEDFEALWQHYTWMQGLGVHWFSLSYDDIDTKGQDMAKLGEAHAGLANKLFRRLREKDPQAQLIFCPVYYWGCGDAGDAKLYLDALGRVMDKDLFVFWTGDGVVTLRITRACAEKFKTRVKHRIIIWDNYPVNDRTGALHLGPVTGRDPDLDEVAYGYMSNPHCPQNEINRIPLLTCADYAYNPRAYNPEHSIGQAIIHLAETRAQQWVLKDLVELYPGNLLSGSTNTGYNCVLEKFKALLREPNAKDPAGHFIARVQDAASRLDKEFPGRFARTKETVADHLAKLKNEFKKKFMDSVLSAGTVTISRDILKDKIKGGWAGQAIGCTFGGPTEFRFQGTFIQDYQPIPWDESSILSSFKNNPGLYDDIYMDLTFMETFEKEGLDVSSATLARAFATAKFPLWHANQMARYNILSGLLPPQSGHWLNNPHADDIDFQIEADFAGLMSPGMVNTAAEFCDRVGHIMNYGDGWYGGVYVAAMYALAFVSENVEFIAEEALKAIPAEGAFARTMQDVIRWHRENPRDWKDTWFKVQRKWSEDIGCPEGVFSSFNIDAKINCAWVLLGLLYGDGDFGKTLSVSARSGDDSDCNPCSAGGILGTIIGYKNIPDFWKKGLQAAESIPFKYTRLSLNDAYGLSFKHSLENIDRNGGSAGGQDVQIKVQEPKPVRLEVSFEGHHPSERRSFNRPLEKEVTFEFEGIGFAVNGEATSRDNNPYRFKVEMSVDGKSVETSDLPTDILVRKETLFWKYALPSGRHKIQLKVLNPSRQAKIVIRDAIFYKED
jgi:ADP-ribosylglycohydrolase